MTTFKDNFFDKREHLRFGPLRDKASDTGLTADGLNLAGVHGVAFDQSKGVVLLSGEATELFLPYLHLEGIGRIPNGYDTCNAPEPR